MSVSVPLVGFFGSRRLPSGASGLVRQVVASVVQSGRGAAVGCASGGDAAALSALVSGGVVRVPFLRVFAVGGPSGQGFWRGSALSLVQQVASLRVPWGGQRRAVVSWWAGGSASVPLRVRLRQRSRAFVQAVAASGPGAGLVGFVVGGWQVSPGSWGSVQFALSLGLPVVLFPVGCSVSCFPRSFRGVGQVRWVPAGSGVWARGFRAVVVSQGASS